jgi:hypothetical protein
MSHKIPETVPRQRDQQEYVDAEVYKSVGASCHHRRRRRATVGLTLGTWNCRKGIDRKRAAIQELACDVLVVPECSATPEIAKSEEVSFAWQGEIPTQGLGVFGFNGWTLRTLTDAPALEWLLPIEAVDREGSQSFTLLAIWTVKRKKDGRPSYAGQLTQVIDTYRERLGPDRVALAGDFNASAQGSRNRPHLNNLEELSALGAESAYHRMTGSHHGAEKVMTLRWVGPGRVRYEYHCDFVFLSRAMLSSVESAEVGSMATWVESKLSDHCPVVVKMT